MIPPYHIAGPQLASVVNTDARKAYALRAGGGGDQRRLAGSRSAGRGSFQKGSFHDVREVCMGR